MPKAKGRKTTRRGACNIPASAINGACIDVAKLKPGKTYEFAVPRTGGLLTNLLPNIISIVPNTISAIGGLFKKDKK